MINVSSSDERDHMLTDLLPDLTPLIDVMFMLIVFLVLTANASIQYFDVSLPEEHSTNTQSPDPNTTLNITLFSEDNKWGIDDTIYEDKARFEKTLTSMIAKDKPAIVLFSDKNANVGQLTHLLTFLERHNSSVSHFAIRP